jgi:predicted phosphodiesterase
MSRIGLLSDAHGNPLGLRATLGALRAAGVDAIYFLGDAVGYMPGEVEVLETLAADGIACQRGNHEGMLLGQLPLDPQRDRAYGLAAARDRMSERMREFVAGWPDRRELEIGGRRLLLVHGSPRDHLSEYVYPDSDVDWIGDLGYDAVFMGNTHRPFVTRRGATLIANVGSCGLPRDQGDLAACAVYDPAAHDCRVIRVPVDPSAVMAQFPQVTDLVYAGLHRRTVQPFGGVLERGPGLERAQQ